MKTRVETERYMPGIGETWKHRGQDYVFIRLPDDTGAKMIPEKSVEEYFFSVDAYNGLVSFTRRDADDLVPAVPCGALGGKPVFAGKTGKPAKVPGVGEYFRGPGRCGEQVFLRIPDADGQRALGDEYDADLFYAVNVGDGSAVRASLRLGGYRTLKAVSVGNDGTVVFTEA